MPGSCTYMDFGHRDLRFRRFRCPKAALIWISGIGITNSSIPDAQKLPVTLFRPVPGVGGHHEAASGGKSHSANGRAVRQAGALKLLGTEAL